MANYVPNNREELKKLCDDLTINLGKINTCKITDMSNLFRFSERRDFSGIETWDVSNVKNMSGMFWGSKFNGDISNWDVSNVTDMSFMFFISKFNGDISKWDVSNVTDMSEMFAKSLFNGKIEDWNVCNVEKMENIFSDSHYSQSLKKWNIIKATVNTENYAIDKWLFDRCEIIFDDSNFIKGYNVNFDILPSSFIYCINWFLQNGFHQFCSSGGENSIDPKYIQAYSDYIDAFPDEFEKYKNIGFDFFDSDGTYKIKQFKIASYSSEIDDKNKIYVRRPESTLRCPFLLNFGEYKISEASGYHGYYEINLSVIKNNKALQNYLKHKGCYRTLENLRWRDHPIEDLKSFLSESKLKSR